VCPLLWPSTLFESWLPSILVLAVSRVTLYAHHSSISPSVVVKADPTLKLVSICKISPIVGTIPTLELRKWACLRSCHWDQTRAPHDRSSFFEDHTSFVISGWDYLTMECFNTPGVTVVAVVHLQCFHNGCYSKPKLSGFQIQIWTLSGFSYLSYLLLLKELQNF
jgi:hypothetical protein